MYNPRITTLFIALAVTVSGACLANPYDKITKYHANNPTPRIIGGEDAQKSEFPFMASLISSSTPTTGSVQPFCGGSLITKRFVLTAAHCVQGGKASPASIDVLIGLHDVNAPSEAKRHKLKKIYGDAQTDTALLELQEPVEGITPIKLITPELAAQLKDGDMMTVIGFGVTIENEERPVAKILQKADVPQFNQALCNKNYQELVGSRVNEFMICAGYAKIKKDSCNGDSGGPLFMKKGGELYQTGVVSWGAQVCASDNLPGVYVRVSKMLDWLYERSAGLDFDRDMNLGYLELEQQAVHTLNIDNNSEHSFVINKVEFNDLDNLATPEIVKNNCNSTEVATGKSCAIEFKFAANKVGPAKLTMALHTTHPMVKLTNSKVSVSIAEKSDLDMKKLVDIKHSDFVNWHTGGDGIWQAQSDKTDVGDSAIESASVDDGQAAGLLGVIKSDRVTELSFSYLVSSESNKDGLKVLVNQKEQLFASGDTQDAFLNVKLPMTKGIDRVAFAYSKDTGGEAGQDRTYLDNIQLTITNKAPVISIKKVKPIEISQSTTIDASGTKDPDGDTLTFSWKLIGKGNGASLTDTSSKVAKFKAGNKAGKVEVELTVTDKYGEKSVSKAMIDVKEEDKGGSTDFMLLLLTALAILLSRRKVQTP
ncbi:S1 family peptidase [Shewanella woodyi]|uniref:Peptidase S1 and S6 chymotrypsin/Hap n=1 Tax=Shewanella woodyi (strain ATCC 51908 / MS32) TaxID=392500 RepID=B1KD22_SHEWM|nr:serine protease [Shewanella woodyi]ACA87857.1 peptidase S1 and S6 chymotrypsin/Hap [Shewanella woodyi ATCC 51908]